MRILHRAVTEPSVEVDMDAASAVMQKVKKSHMTWGGAALTTSWISVLTSAAAVVVSLLLDTGEASFVAALFVGVVALNVLVFVAVAKSLNAKANVGNCVVALILVIVFSIPLLGGATAVLITKSAVSGVGEVFTK